MSEDNEKRRALLAVKTLIQEKQYRSAFTLLQRTALPLDDFVTQMKCAALFEMIPAGELALKPIKIAVLATSTVTHFDRAFKFWLAILGLDGQIFEAEYGTVQQAVLDENSSFYAFSPDITIFFTSYRDIDWLVPPGTHVEQTQQVVQAAVSRFVSFWQAVRARSSCAIIQMNADLPYKRFLGHYDSLVGWGGINALNRFNLELSRAIFEGVTIFDLDYIASIYGRSRWHDTRYWYHSKHPFALDATGLVAKEMARVVGAFKGLSKKCLVLDLDNTLWGGVIGDDGWEGIKLGNGPDGEAFQDFQKYLLGLKHRGVILAVCSKNQEELAKEPFLRHPDMVLKLDDIVVFKANWDDKVSNIKQIAAQLNIGLDALVFVDDNPAERALVRECLPMVSVPEMPPDPCDYVSTLSEECFFEAVTFSKEDETRSDFYRGNITRNDFQKQFTDISAYLQSLEMYMTVGEFDSFHLPRAAQLINKSNQFHLTTTRYAESELMKMSSDGRTICRYYKLKDRFGDNGLISVVILKAHEGGVFFVDTWVMSCRVLSRGAEEFICRDMMEQARSRKGTILVGRYIPTSKNKLVAALYERLGFQKGREENGTTDWHFDLKKKTPPYQVFIQTAP